MKILIIGGSRGIGKVLLECAVKDGHQVTVLARYPEKIKTTGPDVHVIQGDVLDKKGLTSAVEDQEAVVSCIGVPITFKPVSLFSQAAENLVAVMEGSIDQKFIAVTGIGAGDSSGHGGFLYDKIFKPIFLKTIYQDKDREEAIIKGSNLNWLIVRPAGLTNGPRTGIYHAINDLEGVTAKRISRLDVADFILRQLAEPDQFGNTPLLTY